MRFPDEILSLNATALPSFVFSAAKQIPRLIVSASVSQDTHATTLAFLEEERCLNVRALVSVRNSPRA